jgi:hypothetical protein
MQKKSAMSRVFDALTSGGGSVQAALRQLRRSGNRTAPEWVQQQLIDKAQAKRERKGKRRINIA